jgi:outer membrane immunogenic protein
MLPPAVAFATLRGRIFVIRERKLVIKQCVTSLAVAIVATALAASAQAQSGLAGLSPAAQVEIQKLSPAQRAALAHSLLGDTAAPSNPAAINPAAGSAASSSVAQASGGIAAAPAAAMAPMPSAPAYNWNGCYLAAGFGVGMFNDEHHLQVSSLGTTLVSANSTTGGNGLLGRFGAGCDYQVAPRIILGAFGDFDLTNMAGTMNEIEFTAKENQDWAWAAGMRAGYLLWPQTLGYIDGGFTQARFHFANAGLPTTVGFAVPGFTFGGEFGGYVANGVFGGAGFEMALDFLPGLFWRNEYRFAYYMPMNDPAQIEGIPVTERVQPTVQTVTSSFVYKLDWNRFLR